MSFSKSTVAIGALSFAVRVAAHGFVSGITVNGVYNQGYDPSFQYQNPAPEVAGWSDPENLENGFIAPDAFGDDNIICHKSATPGAKSIEVAAGSKVQLHWNTWPESHHGPVIDYIANCNGDCSTVEKSTLRFTKTQEDGLIDGSSAPGKWASDYLIADNNTWTTIIPESIAPGNYVLRHEIIALHSAGDANGAQNYPQCVNLKITGSGTNELADGIPATEFYTPEDAGIKVSIYQPLASYEIPGPALMAGGSSGSQPGSGDDSESETPAPAPVSSSATAPAPTNAPGSGEVPSNPPTPTTLVTSLAPTATAPAAEDGQAEEGEADDDDDSTCS